MRSNFNIFFLLRLLLNESWRKSLPTSLYDISQKPLTTKKECGFPIKLNEDQCDGTISISLVLSTSFLKIISKMLVMLWVLVVFKLVCRYEWVHACVSIPLGFFLIQFPYLYLLRRGPHVISSPSLHDNFYGITKD